MSRKFITQSCLVAVVSAMLFGCQSQKINMEEIMKPPPRPAELDQLDMFLGAWEGMAQIKFAGSEEVMEHMGKSTYEWMPDKWIFVEKGEYDVGDGKTMYMTGYWWWDADEKLFQMSWVGSDGGVGTGTGRYDENTRTWTMKSKGMNPYNQFKTVGEGTAKFIDDKTIEWTWEEEIPSLLGAKEFMEMKGTSHKK